MKKLKFWSSSVKISAFSFKFHSFGNRSGMQRTNSTGQMMVGNQHMMLMMPVQGNQQMPMQQQLQHQNHQNQVPKMTGNLPSPGTPRVIRKHCFYRFSFRKIKIRSNHTSPIDRLPHNTNREDVNQPFNHLRLQPYAPTSATATVESSKHGTHGRNEEKKTISWLGKRNALSVSYVRGSNLGMCKNERVLPDCTCIDALADTTAIKMFFLFDELIACFFKLSVQELFSKSQKRCRMFGWWYSRRAILLQWPTYSYRLELLTVVNVATVLRSVFAFQD